MTMDNLKNRWRPATASPADPIGKPAQSAAERLTTKSSSLDHKQNSVPKNLGSSTDANRLATHRASGLTSPRALSQYVDRADALIKSPPVPVTERRYSNESPIQ